MKPIVYECAVFLLEALISGIYLQNLLDEKYSKGFYVPLWCATAVAAVLLTPPFAMLRIGIIAAFEFVYVCFMYENDAKKKAGVFLFDAVLRLVAALCTKAMCSVATTDCDGLVPKNGGESCVCRLLYLLVYSIAVSVVFQTAKERRGVEFPWTISTQAVIGIGELAAALTLVSVSDGIGGFKSPWLVVVAAACMIAANISIGLLAPYLLKRITMSAGMDYGEELRSMEYKYYEMSAENEKKLNVIRHDISNHIQVVYSLLANGENRRGMELIDELKNRYSLVEQMVYCNNPVVNIILSNKKSEAESKNIETHVKVKESLDNIPVSDFDLSTVICNLLDNAIRGCVCSEQTHPRLVVEILQKNQYLVVRVLNSCRVSMKFKNTDRLETTKSKSQAHGLGMPIVAGIARKYGGDFVVSAANGIFTATVVLSLKSNRKK